LQVSTLWDTYFDGGRDHRLDSVSIMQMPYLEGDYWPGESENLLLNIQVGAGQPAIRRSHGRQRGGDKASW
jgi:E1A/CREB-binding protein